MNYLFVYALPMIDLNKIIKKKEDIFCIYESKILKLVSTKSNKFIALEIQNILARE